MKKPLLLSLLFLLPTPLAATNNVLAFSFYNKKEEPKMICMQKVKDLSKKAFYNKLNSVLRKNSSGDTYSNDELKENFNITIDIDNKNKPISIFDIKDETWPSLLQEALDENNAIDIDISIAPQKWLMWKKKKIESHNFGYPTPIQPSAKDIKITIDRGDEPGDLPNHTTIKPSQRNSGTFKKLFIGDEPGDLPNHTTIKPSQRNSGIFKKQFTGDDTTTSNEAFYAKLAGGAIIIVLGGLGLIQLTYKSKKSKPKSTKKHPKTRHLLNEAKYFVHSKN